VGLCGARAPFPRSALAPPGAELRATQAEARPEGLVRHQRAGSGAAAALDAETGALAAGQAFGEAVAALGRREQIPAGAAAQAAGRNQERPFWRGPFRRRPARRGAAALAVRGELLCLEATSGVAPNVLEDT